MRPWGLARVGGSAISRLTSRPSMASLTVNDIPNGGSPNGSVLSLPASENKDEVKLAELQRKLDETNAALVSKSNAIAALLVRVNNAESSSKATQTELEEHKLQLNALEEGKRSAERQRMEYQERLAELQTQHLRELSELESARLELGETRKKVTAQEHLVIDLRSRVQAAEADLDTTRGKLHAHQSSSAEDAAAWDAQMEAEHNARLEAESELEVARVNITHLETTGLQAQIEVESKSAELERLAVRIEALVSQLTQLHASRESLSTRVRHLELEVTEAMQERQKLELDQSEALVHTRSLQDRLADVTARMQHATEEARRREGELRHAKDAVANLIEEVERSRVAAEQTEQIWLSQLHETRQHVEELGRERLEALRRAAAAVQAKEDMLKHFTHEMAVADAERAALQQTNGALRRYIDELTRTHKDQSGCIVQ